MPRWLGDRDLPRPRIPRYEELHGVSLASSAGQWPWHEAEMDLAASYHTSLGGPLIIPAHGGHY